MQAELHGAPRQLCKGTTGRKSEGAEGCSFLPCPLKQPPGPTHQPEGKVDKTRSWWWAPKVTQADTCVSRFSQAD